MTNVDVKYTDPYKVAVFKKDPSLSSLQVMVAADLLREIEEDPVDHKDYKSIAIAINAAREYY